MKIVVIGGTGLIGTKLVQKLRRRGHDAIPASPKSGVNTLTGEGLAEAFKNAEVVVDVSNSPSFEDQAVMNFFETSTRNILDAEKSAGVKHHVALSVVGTDRLQASGYFRAKMVQEKLIKNSKIPFTILRSTQFFEFVGAIAQASTEGQTVRLPPSPIQPISSEEVAEVLTELTLGKPINGTAEVAGPDKFGIDQLVREFLSTTRDSRKVVTDSHAHYYGIELEGDNLIPAAPRIASLHYKDWLTGQANKNKRSLLH
jgi:uncharacterized protein YbjT (DUF2867 family)